MTSRWYCTDCEAEIDPEAVADHEAKDHHVKGVIRPDRLLGNDPWNLQVEVDGDLDSETAILPEDGGED